MSYEMNIKYAGPYRSWITKDQIKIGETNDWSVRYKSYKENYGLKHWEKHKNYPRCDGCLEDVSLLEKDHNHIVQPPFRIEVDFSTEERRKIESLIRDEFKKSKYKGTKDYFDKSKYEEIKEMLMFLVENWEEKKKEYDF